MCIKETIREEFIQNLGRMNEIFESVSKQNLKKLFKIFGKNIYFQKLMIDELNNFQNEHLDLFIQYCPSIFETQLHNLIQKEFFEDEFNWENVKRINYDNLEKQQNLFNMAVDIHDNPSELYTIDFLNLVMKKCPNIGSKFILKLLIHHKIMPTRQTLELFLKKHIVECPIGKIILTHLAQHVSPNQKSMEILLNRVYLPTESLLFLIHTYNLKLTRQMVFQKTSGYLNNVSNLYIYIFETYGKESYQDLLFLCDMGTTHKEAIEYLIEKGINPNCQYLVKAFYRGYSSPWELIIEHLHKSFTKAEQFEIENIILKHVGSQDTYPLQYIMLLLEKKIIRYRENIKKIIYYRLKLDMDDEKTKCRVLSRIKNLPLREFTDSPEPLVNPI